MLGLHRSTTRRARVLGLLLPIALAACDRRDALSPARPAPAHAYRQLNGAPDSDPVMGSLSGVARHLAAALQDSATRVELARFMKDSSAGLLGVNLDACDQDRMSKRLFRAGEEHGAGSSAAACSAARRLNGLSLYMDPSRLADWDGTTIPIVTAIAEMQRPLPRAFHGYRSPRTMIDLPSDGSLQGPIFVVLPVAHPARAKEQARNDHPVQIITLPDPPVPDSVTSRPH